MTKIVITGAPSSGKSSSIKKMVNIFWDKPIIFVPESAIILLSGGLPPPNQSDIEQIHSFQQAIIGVQQALEFIYSRQNPTIECLVFDRGLLDGASFWPLGITDYLTKFNIDMTAELSKFDHVIFFNLPEKKYFGGVTPLRFHNYEQSVESEKQLRSIWQKHQNFIEVKATDIFEEKIQRVVDIITKIIS